MGSLTCATILGRAVHAKARQALTSLHKGWLVRTKKKTKNDPSILSRPCRIRTLATRFSVQRGVSRVGHHDLTGSMGGLTFVKITGRLFFPKPYHGGAATGRCQPAVTRTVLSLWAL